MGENFSDAVLLKEMVVQQPKTVKPQKAEEGVTANKAILITTQNQNKQTKSKGKKGKNNHEAAATAAPADDIVLPD